MKRGILFLAMVALPLALSCSGKPGSQTRGSAGGGGIAELMKARGLSEADAVAALKTCA